MIPFKKIAEITRGKCTGRCTGNVKYLLTDSRRLSLPKDVLFIAIAGDYNDGHRFIPSLIRKGVSQFIVDRKPEDKWCDQASFIIVDSTINALQQLAGWWRSQFNIPVIGVTGSNGKTIVKEWLARSLSDDKRLTRSPGSYNSQIGVPLSVWMLSKEAQLALFEAGISKPGEMARLQQVIQPTVGLFTNLGDAHQENFSSFEQKLSEKLQLFKNAQTVIFQDQHDWIAEKIKSQLKDQQFFTWSFQHNTDVKAILKNGNLDVWYNDAHLSIAKPFHDKASLENLMHTISVLFYLGYNTQFISNAITHLEPVPMRLEQKAGKLRNTIINDSYNSDLGSLANALDFLEQQKQHSRKVLILSDIFQSGYIKDNLYKEVAVLVNAHKPDYLIGVGPDLMHYKDLFHTEGTFVRSTTEVVAQLDTLPVADSTVLLKGSRAYHFEQIDRALEAKSHRTTLEVNLNALTHNLNYFKSLLNNDTGIIVMVKAFSYGSGSHEIANELQYNRVSYLATAYTDEGVELRTRGVELPLMVMNPDESDFDNLIQYRLEPVIFSFDMLKKFGRFLLQTGERRFPVHIKLNTGMNRSGFNPEELEDFIKQIMNYPSMYLRTVFSHLAASDGKQHDAFTRGQAQLFQQMSTKIEQKLGHSIHKHLLNSAGIERFPEYQFDYVRLGIGLYGVSVQHNDVKQIGRLKTRIAQIREVKPGETVGYGRKGEVKTPKTIATIPVGYADGFRRALSNGVGKVWINGGLYPVIGNVCMDMTMIDITGADVSVGDEVIIFGPELSIETLAEWLKTIPYEILTSVAARVKRIYIKE